MQEVQSRPEALQLMNEPGVGPVTAFVLTVGPVSRFANSKKLGRFKRAER